MSVSTIVTPAILDKVIGLLMPFFLDGVGGDPQAARHAVSRLLADYDCETEEELRLAAEIIGFGFGALDALGKSMAPGLSLNAILRLRGSANTQHRSANQCQRTLDQLRGRRRIARAEPRAKVRPLPLNEPATPEMLIASDGPGAPRPPDPATTPAASPSRQQRRAAQRKAEKAQRRQAELARREARREARTISAGAAAIPLQPRPIDQTLGA